jgi:DNA (cytosine-5)-methyltransferase 1
MTVAQIPLPDFMRKSAKRNALPGEEIIVDLFAGGGGASTGIEHGLGRDVDDAINHDAEAIEMHARNHPGTRHHRASVWEVPPAEVARGRPVGLLWLSPDCTDFSRAKGGQPIRDRRIRSLAWVGAKWARDVAPRVIMLENVREFQEWGPLIHKVAPEGTGYLWQVGKRIAAKKGRVKRPKPIVVVGPKSDAASGDWQRFWAALGYKAKPLMVRDPKRIGQTFRRFVRQLESSGYQVQHRVINAADHGVPTHRKRFFMIARRDGAAIVWPERTHGPKERTNASEKMDRGSEGEPLGKRRCKDTPHGKLRSDLFGEAAGDAAHVGGGSTRSAGFRSDAAVSRTVRDDRQPYRTAAECIDWSIPCPSIFGRKKPLAPNTLRRIVMGLLRYVFMASEPFIVRCDHGGDHFRGQSAETPLATVTGHHGFGVVAPHLVEHANSNWSKGHRPADEPAPTVTSQPKGGSWAMAAAHLTHYHTEKGGEVRASSIDSTLPTQDTSNRFGVVTAVITKNTPNDKPCHGMAEPLHTVTTIHNKFQLAECTLIPFVAGVGGRAGQSPATAGDGPIGTITAKNDRALTECVLMPLIAQNYGEAPHQQTRAQRADEPLRTITPSNNSGVFVAAHVQKFYGGVVGSDLTLPLPTITSVDHNAIAAAYLTKLRGSGGWKPVDAPIDTIVATATTFCLTLPYLAKMNHGEKQWFRVDEPLRTVLAGANHHALACPFCIKYYGCGTGQEMDDALHTVTTKDRFGVVFPRLVPEVASPHQIGRAAEVYAFLMEYKSLLGMPPNVTFHHLDDGAGYVTVRIGGDEYLMVDIGLRMLTPRELLRAQFSPELAADYILPKSNAAAVHKIGNSVCPLVVSALVRANLSDLIVPNQRKRRSA